MSDIASKIELACERLRKAIAKFPANVGVFGLFSGGHDSLSATYIASLCGMTGAVHINTGIGVQRTRQFVYDTCAFSNWPLFEFKAVDNTQANGKPDPQIYRDLVLERGFPGPPHHTKMYNRLKERSLRRLARKCGAHARGKNKKHVIYVSGCRSQESVRRMGHVEEMQVLGREVWVSPIHDWTKSDTSALIEYAGLSRNPIVDLIHKSGECLCGAFAEKGELEELSLWPDTRDAYNEIKALEAEVLAKGFKWGWEGRPPCRNKEPKISKRQQMLCWSCTKQPALPTAAAKAAMEGKA